MEVTSTNSNHLAPKLGQTGQDAFASDAFSSHLAETDTHAPSQAETRSDDQHADDRRADERQADAEKAAAAEDERRADERDRDAEARNEEDDTENSDRHDASSVETDTDISVAETDATELVDGEDASQAEVNTGADTDGTASGKAEEEKNATAPSTDGEQTTATTANTVKPENVSPLTKATETDETSDTGAAATNTDTLSADELALQTAQSSNNTASANTDATAGAAAQQAVRPTTTTNGQATQQGTQAVASAGDQTSGLQNPLEAGLQSDVDGGADGERGLGHQAAEAMAGKSKTATSNTQVSNAPQVTPTTPVASVAPVTPLQALATAGLNLSSLPSDLNLDLLNLNAPNQGTPTGTPQNSNAVLVRFGALPGQAQATQVPNTAIALQISKHVARGVSTFEIRLDPAEMGRIDVKLELAQDGRVTAHLAVEKAETLDLLQKDAKALEQALKDAGLDADSDTLNFSLKNGGADTAEGGGAENLSADDDQSIGEDDAEEALMNAVVARQIEAAARGGIDVSI